MERAYNIIRRVPTAKKCGVVALTVDRWADDPRYAHLKFPKKVQLGDNTVGFVEHEINDWLIAQAAKRDDAAARVAAKASERDDVDADGNNSQGEDDDVADDQAA